VYSPAEEDVEQARAVIEAYQSAGEQGRGAIAIDGKMIDAASIRVALTTVTRHDLIHAKTGA
jgi:citrate lyase subunit beta/citryl-CoA lyase